MAQRATIVQTPPLAMRAEDAAAYLAMSPSKFRDMVADGRMPKPVQIDGMVSWRRVDLDNAFATLTERNPFDEPEGCDA